jgi:nitrate/TMAO reductase-like tetraheme cytochrome c subunit
MVIRTEGIRSWLSPVVYLSSNLISRIGVVLVTTATVFWLFLLPSTFAGAAQHPYIGILTFLILPGVFFMGLGLIPIGILLRRRSEQKHHAYPSSFAPLTLRSVELKRLGIFVGITTLINLVLGSIFTYQAVTFMETVSFCGQTCHTVMQPEFTAYQNSPHSRVDCVACHIGAGASWFVKSKLSGLGQVFAVAFNTYPRPIPTPVKNLRPARETCEACHWPTKFTEDRLRIIPSYADDETNSLTKTVLLMRMGGGRPDFPGIHGAHLAPGVRIYYNPSDESRQTIPRVEYTNDRTGRKTVYTASGVKPEALKNLPTRLMDCMDCHNRPTHTFQLASPAVNAAMANGLISTSLPYVKKEAIDLLQKTYASREEAEAAIPAGLDKFYQQKYPDVYAKNRAAIAGAGQAIVAIYDRNIFPAMKITWGTYPNNLGHMDFPGCFRCHDGDHTSASGKNTIPNDCDTCHHILAMDEANPKILTDLGITSQGQSPAAQQPAAGK